MDNQAPIMMPRLGWRAEQIALTCNAVSARIASDCYSSFEQVFGEFGTALYRPFRIANPGKRFFRDDLRLSDEEIEPALPEPLQACISGPWSG
jgi:hypothetical protein